MTETQDFTQSDDIIISAQGLTKRYGDMTALDSASFTIKSGRIVGVIGANGAGKTTMLNAILGLTAFEGELSVLGLNPVSERSKLMHEICFISDVATLPKWMTVNQVLDYVQGVHPKFSRQVALKYLSRTKVPLGKRIKKLSKGMTTQVHLAVVMAIDAKLLVLDEPTLGLDIMFRKQFHRSLLEEYIDEHRTVIITTHQVEEIEHILTDVIFIRDGRIVLDTEMESLAGQFCEVVVDNDAAAEVRQLRPIAEHSSLGRTAFVFEGLDTAKLNGTGKVRHLGLADIFVAKMQGEAA